MTASDSTAVSPARQMGQHLRLAREQAGWAVDMVAAQLRMPKSVILALEEGDWSHLGAPVFVRGHLRSYARFLGTDLAGLDRIVAAPTPVMPMVSTGRGPQVFGWLGVRMVYVVITVLVGVPIWIAAQRHLSPPDVAPAVALEMPEIQPTPLPVIAPVPDEASALTPSAPPPAMPALPPVTAASLLPSRVPEPSASADIVLHINQDSWVELYASGGHSLEQTLIKAGEVRRFAYGQLRRVVLGNADGVTLRIGGEVQDLSAWRRANVARFAVSSDGVIGPASD